MSHHGSTDQGQFHFLFLLSASQGKLRDEKLILEGINPQVLYMTARPGRDRAYIFSSDFFSVWHDNEKAFTENRPQIGLVHNQMACDNYKVSQSALPLTLMHPKKIDGSSWQFDVSECDQCHENLYRGITLFIDWLPNVICPEPIKLLLPKLFSKE